MYKEVSLTHYKMEFDPENLIRCWNECKEKADIQLQRQAIDVFNQQNQYKKRGIAIVPIKYGIGFSEAFLNQVTITLSIRALNFNALSFINPLLLCFKLKAAALVHIYKDGSVLVSHGGIEMGQGIHTKVQQV